MCLNEIKSIVPDLESRVIEGKFFNGDNFIINVPEHKDFFKEYIQLKEKVYGIKEEITGVGGTKKFKEYTFIRKSDGKIFDREEISELFGRQTDVIKREVLLYGDYKHIAFELYIDGVLTPPRRKRESFKRYKTARVYTNSVTGEQLPVCEWAKRLGLSHIQLRFRIDHNSDLGGFYLIAGERTKFLIEEREYVVK